MNWDHNTCQTCLQKISQLTKRNLRNTATDFLWLPRRKSTTAQIGKLRQNVLKIEYEPDTISWVVIIFFVNEVVVVIAG